MDCDDHLSMAGSGTGVLLMSTSILGGENSPPAEGAAGNEPGLNRTNIFSDETREKVKSNWLWIILGILALIFVWKYFFAAPATA